MPYSTSPFGIIRIAGIRQPSNLPLINWYTWINTTLQPMVSSKKEAPP